jgi:hypothetical protein
MYALVLMLALVVPASARCPSGTVQGLKQDDCYKLVSASLATSWYSAAGQCDEGNLASVPGAFTNGFLQGLYDGWSASYVWLGAWETNNAWSWADGTPFTWNNWPRGQPANGTNLCLASSVESGLWYAQSCYTTLPYVCKVPSLPDSCSFVEDEKKADKQAACPAGFACAKLPTA